MNPPTDLGAKIVRNPGRVRILDGAQNETLEGDRRTFLRAVAAYGASLPAVHLLSGSFNAALAQAGGVQPATVAEGNAGTVRVVRDFISPRLELVRLLREAAEIEHSLMIQYLYAAYSVKPAYQELIGAGNPNTNDLLGVAIQEMQHLMDVNRLLVELGAAPVFIRQDFPYEPDIYPFPLNLEPLSRESLAKYSFCEAPVAALNRARAKSAEDVLFIDTLEATLNGRARPNHVGSLYDGLIAMLRELAKRPGEIRAPDQWIARLIQIKDEGEEGHFKFFKAAFMGSHKGFKGQDDVWGLPQSDERYPALKLPMNPSAYIGSENQISDPGLRNLAWLGNLNYWLFLMLLDVGYRSGSAAHKDASKMVMMGPFWVLVRFLPTRGIGMPFDQLSMGYSAGLDQRQNTRMLAALVGEIEAWEARLKDDLPPDYPEGTAKQAVDSTMTARPGQKAR